MLPILRLTEAAAARQFSFSAMMQLSGSPCHFCHKLLYNVVLSNC